jgi:hypothetical protein
VGRSDAQAANQRWPWTWLTPVAGPSSGDSFNTEFASDKPVDFPWTGFQLLICGAISFEFCFICGASVRLVEHEESDSFKGAGVLTR